MDEQVVEPVAPPPVPDLLVPPVPNPEPNPEPIPDVVNGAEEAVVKPIPRNYPERCVYDKLTVTNLLSTFAILIFSLIMYDYAWIHFGVAMVVLIIFFTILYNWYDLLLYYCLEPPFDDKARTINLRRRMWIGYGAAIFCGVFPQIVALWFRDYYLVVLSVGFVCNLLSFVLLSTYVENGINKFDVKFPRNQPRFPYFKFNCYLLHFVWGALLLGYYALFYGMQNFIFTCIVIAYYNVLYPVYTVQFLRITIYGIKIRKTRKIPDIQELIIYVPDEKMTKGIQCHSCLTEYSEQSIPRFLIVCGHTLCEVCVEGHMNFDRDAVVCPFCAEDTPLPTGRVTDLPKNLELVGFMRGGMEM
ncbi:hypothetical protein CAEBREN_16326 [Caenorhabditis brenneri]|uniref:RING-type domain-containing protein n=1 Tax=Caenorhabditis brenneri TaxID=135651 RepID=G0N7Y5_CAEBE|nr:hypothetical protein CAEBREN_16326 [Caenorhabditis brenneri]